MKAIRFNVTIPRYALVKSLGKLRSEVYYKGPFAILYMDDVPEPGLVNEGWVKVKTTYGGVCGSDLNMIFLHDSPYSEPFIDMPYTVGHENVGTIVEVGSAVEGFAVGDRVVADPMLPCAARDIEPPCGPCSRGDFSQCLNMLEGSLPPALNLGYSDKTGGSWSECFVAHHSQLLKVPDSMTDEEAVVIDALASSLHPVMRNLPEPGQAVLVYGCGIIGMLAVASLKALVPDCRVIVIARYPFQARVARDYGADDIIMQKEVKDLHAAVAELTGARVLKPMIGGGYLNGGPDTVFDCVGHTDTLDDAFRMTRSGGTVVLVGLASVVKNIDWTPVWFKELTIRGTLCSATESFEGRTQKTYAWARDLIEDGRIKVDHLLTHVWKLEDYERMIETATTKGSTDCIKQAFKL